MIPAVIYAAKSTADPHGSIPTQIDDGRQVAEREGWTVTGDPFVDEAFSAYSGPRGPALADAFAAAEQLAAEHGQARLIVQHSDRLARGDGRNAPHLVEYVLRARRSSITIVSKQDPQTFSDQGLVYSALGGDRGHDDSKRKAQSVADGARRRKVERGLHNGGPEKLGYRTVRDEYGRPAPGPRVIDRAGARIVRRIFDALAAGISQNQIARELNADQVPTATGGGRWYQGTVRKIGSDPFFAGYLRDGDDLVRGEHDPIVDLEQWERVQEITARRRTSGDGQRGRTSTRPALFTHGHLRCGFCGAAMGVRFKPARYPGGADWHRYVCTSRKDGRACEMRPIDADAIEAMMLDELKARPGILVDRVRDAVTSLLAARDTTVDRLAEAERELAGLRGQIDRVERDYRSGELSAKSHDRLVAAIEEETAAAKGQVEQLRARAAELTSTLSGHEVDAAVAHIMERIGEVLTDAARIETARNVIRQAWPTIVAHRDGEVVRLETGDVSEGFAAALSSTIEYDGLPMISIVEHA